MSVVMCCILKLDDFEGFLVSCWSWYREVIGILEVLCNNSWVG